MTTVTPSTQDLYRIPAMRPQFTVELTGLDGVDEPDGNNNYLITSDSKENLYRLFSVLRNTKSKPSDDEKPQPLVTKVTDSWYIFPSRFTSDILSYCRDPKIMQGITLNLIKNPFFKALATHISKIPEHPDHHIEIIAPSSRILDQWFKALAPYTADITQRCKFWFEYDRDRLDLERFHELGPHMKQFHGVVKVSSPRHDMSWNDTAH
ncbi:hypothetical protein BJX99DRAFT_254163 [Aspergillus californicus]